MKKKLFLILIVFQFSCKAINESYPKWVGLGVGSGTGLISSYCAYTKFKENNLFCTELTSNQKLTIAGLALVSGGVAGFLAYKLAKYYTPDSKYNRAIRIIDRIKQEDLVVKDFRDTVSFIKYILGRFNSNWSLVDARSYLVKCKIDLLEARQLLSSANTETIADEYRYNYIHQDSKKIIPVIDRFFDNIIERMYILISHRLYKEQLKRYERYKKEERTRDERRKEQWEKQREKNRDREFLNNLANGTPTNVGINFNMG